MTGLLSTYRMRLAGLFPKAATTALLIAAACTALAIGIVAVMRSPVPVVVMSLETELLVHRVQSPDLSSFPVVNARLSDVGDCAEPLVTGGRFTGLVRPPAGSLLSYHWAPDQLLIDIQSPRDGDKAAATVLSDRYENECRLPLERLRILVSPGPGTNSPGWQLPVAGPAIAGSQFGVALAPTAESRREYAMLRGGTLSVYGRSFGSGMLFPISGAQFELPAGSRVASADILPLGTAATGPSWYGVATYDAFGFQVSATADAEKLLLFRPNGPPETFGIGLLAGILGDPGLGLIAFGIASFFAIAGLMTGLISLWRDRADPAQ
jgi:hypothetical protein